MRLNEMAGASGVGARAGAPAFVMGLALAAAVVVPAWSGSSVAAGMVVRYNGPADGPDGAVGVAVAPDGSTVYVTGSSYGGPGVSDDFATIAYDSASGQPRWVTRFDGPGNSIEQAAGLALSPDGTAVFVTGSTFSGPSTTTDFATLAYDSSTGAPRWLATYDGPAHQTDAATAVAVSPDGMWLYVTGASTGAGSSLDILTVAYDAATGEQHWVKRIDGPAAAADESFSIAVAPDGRTVFVTGYTTAGSIDYATVAYVAGTGTVRWLERYDGPDGGEDVARDVLVGPDGIRVFVGGSSFASGQSDYATLAYDAATGRRLGVAQFDSPGADADAASSLALSPDGSRLFVTGTTGSISRAGGSADFATVAYDTRSATELWAVRYDGPAGGFDQANSAAVSPGGGEVLVTGLSVGAGTNTDFATVIYQAETGTVLAVARYDGPGHGFDSPEDSAFSADGSRAYVTGSSEGSGTSTDYATVAYAFGSG